MKKTLFLILLIPGVILAQEADVVSNKEVARISFGSCSKQDMPDDQLWKEVINQKPDLWIWLGDNIYGDTEDMSVMKAKYDLQKSHPDYQALLAKTEVIGIWDDHDYGVNDGGKEFPAKDQSKVALFDFLDVPQDHPAQKRQAAYQSYTYQSKGKSIKVILLDTRYYRDELKWEKPGTPKKRSLVNETGDVLGEIQWKWLEQQLSDESIDLFIIGSGIQLIATQHQWEKWSNFPMARTRLLKMISDSKTPIIVLSGDRHLSEISKMELNDSGYPLIELTSSSLTSPSGISKEMNEYRLKDLIYDVNFATIEISWDKNLPQIEVTYTGKANMVLQTYLIKY